MRSCWIQATNGQTTFEFRNLPVPRPGPGEVLVRVHAAGLNRGELMASIGWHSAAQAKPAGRELAGEVCEIGEGVTFYNPGMRIMARAHGAFAEYVTVPQGLAMALPERLTWEQGAAIPIAFTTAHTGLCTYGRLCADEWVLVAGAASGVGVACIQAAKYLGAKVAGTSRSSAKLEKLRALGLDAAIHPRGQDFTEPLLQATGGKGVNIAINLVGGSVFAPCLQALANQGRLVIAGYVDGVMSRTLDIEAVHGKRLQICGISNTHLTPAERFESTRRMVRDLMPAFESGAILPLIDRVYEFEELPAAKAYMQTDAHVGKVVVRMPDRKNAVRRSG